MNPPRPSSSLLSVTDLKISLGGRDILRNLSFQVRDGDCLAIIGPNGAGKTALLKALLRLIPYEGEIRWSVNARLGYVPQNVALDRQLPLSAMDLLGSKARLLKLPASQLEEICKDLAFTKELLETPVGGLSGGQFQKVLIAFALLGSPTVLLVDEPTASLDELTEEHVYELLYSLQRDKGLTVLLVSHDLSVVYRYANMVLCLSKDSPCMGPPREVLTPAMLEELYAAPPHYYQHSHEPRREESLSKIARGQKMP